MTKNYIVKELINEMKERIPPGHNLANYLTDTLYMGKEAVYRRLRGEVAFTFDEIAVISHNLGISIDQIIGNHLSNRVTFDLNLLHSPNLMESYYEIVERYLRTAMKTVRHILPPTPFLSPSTHLMNICPSSVYAGGSIRMGR